MPSTCTFLFDRVEPNFNSGEVINGIVNLHTDKEKEVREVYILFEGNASVRWSETERRTVNGKTESHTVYYTAHTQYAYSRTVVYPEGILPRGEHSYNYSIPLPLQCPSSYEDGYGKIKYKISLVINRPLRFDNTFEQDIKIRQTVDLNMDASYRVPLELEDIKRFCCWPCSGGKAILTFNIPQSGYATDDTINYEIQVDNTSMGYDIEGIVVKLKQLHTYTAHSPRTKRRSHNNTITKSSHDEKILRLTKRRFQGSLYVPNDLLPSTLSECIVAIGYYIEVTMITESCSQNSEGEMNIVIGTIPLYDHNIPNANNVMFEPSAPALIMPSDNLPPSYNEVAAPTYEQAISREGSTKYEILK